MYKIIENSEVEKYIREDTEVLMVDFTDKTVQRVNDMSVRSIVRIIESDYAIRKDDGIYFKFMLFVPDEQTEMENKLNETI